MVRVVARRRQGFTHEVEIQGGHRLVTFQVEAQVFNGADAAGDAIAVFAQVLFAAVDGRPAPVAPKGRTAAQTKTGKAPRARAGIDATTRRLAAPKGSPS